MADEFTARQQGQWLVVSMAPDVCKTPMGNSTPPIPYPVTAKLKDATAPAKTVCTNKCPAIVFDMSLTPTTIGDSAGAVKGIKSGTVGAKCYPKGHSDSVCFEKKRIVRHDDQFYMNGK
jgi:hypothetical protein